MVERGIAAEISRLAEARNRAEDDVGFKGAARFVTQSEPIHHAGTKILDDRIGGADEFAGGLESLRRLEIQDDCAFARIDRDERGRQSVVASVETVIAHRVAALWRLDFDDLRSQETEQIRCERPRKDVAEIDDPVMGEGLGQSRDLLC